MTLAEAGTRPRQRVTIPWRRRSGQLGLLLTVPVVVAALCAPLLEQGNAAAALLPPGLAHPFGTDDLGRDILTIVCEGARTSLLVAGAATLLAIVLGTALGLSAGFGPLWLDDVVMRSAEITSTIPPLLLAIVLGALMGDGKAMTALALGLGFWPMIGRVARASAFALRGQPFLRAAIAMGTPPVAVLWRHALPHVAPVVLATAGIVFGGATLAEATLAFVGLGDPTAESLGRLIAHATPYIHVAWWLWVFPGMALVATAVGIGLLCDAT